jgi:hypothetical protein
MLALLAEDGLVMIFLPAERFFVSQVPLASSGTTYLAFGRSYLL